MPENGKNGADGELNAQAGEPSDVKGKPPKDEGSTFGDAAVEDAPFEDLDTQPEQAETSENNEKEADQDTSAAPPAVKRGGKLGVLGFVAGGAIAAGALGFYFWKSQPMRTTEEITPSNSTSGSDMAPATASSAATATLTLPSPEVQTALPPREGPDPAKILNSDRRDLKTAARDAAEMGAPELGTDEFVPRSELPAAPENTTNPNGDLQAVAKSFSAQPPDPTSDERTGGDGIPPVENIEDEPQVQPNTSSAEDVAESGAGEVVAPKAESGKIESAAVDDAADASPTVDEQSGPVAETSTPEVKSSETLLTAGETPGISGTSDAPSEEALDELTGSETSDADESAILNEGSAATEEIVAGIAPQEDPLAAEQIAELQSLKTRLAEADARALAIEEEAARAISDRVAQHQEALAQMAAEKDAEIERLRSQLAMLETEAARFAQSASPEGRARAASALTTIQRSLYKGTPFVDELTTLESIVGTTVEIDALRPVAENGVEPLAALKQRFDEVARAAITASDREEANSAAGELMANIKSVINVRPASATTGTDARSVISRAEARLANDELGQALKELSTLSGGARNAFDPWLVDANELERAATAAENLNRQLIAGTPRSDL